MRLFFARLAVAMAALLIIPVEVSADEYGITIVAGGDAPATITRCVVAKQPYIEAFNASLNYFNRSNHALIDFAIEYRFYDRDHTLIGKTSRGYTPSEPLEPHDVGVYSNSYDYLNVSLSEPITAVANVSCRLLKADFTSHLSWTSGQHWTGGPLSNPPHSQANASNAGSSDGAPNKATHTLQTGLRFDVMNAWNDVASDGLFVHDTIVVHGGEVPMTVRASDFTLQASLANGAQKTYAPMAQAAPMFRRFNALTNQAQYVPQVDPSQDLGKFGSVVIPAHQDVTLTVTFAIPDHLADPNANRSVSFR